MRPYRTTLRFVAVTLLLCLLGAATLRAITTLPCDFDRLVTRAETVFRGTVTGKTCEWTGEGSTRHIVTFVTFRVEETYKGTSVGEQTLRFLGGTVGTTTMDVPDMPRFETGQTAVLFMVGNGRQFCPLVGIAQGRFHVVRDEATGRERIFANGGLPVARIADLGRADAVETAPGQAMAAEDFRAEILTKLATLAR